MKSHNKDKSHGSLFAAVPSMQLTGEGCGMQYIVTAIPYACDTRYSKIWLICFTLLSENRNAVCM